jgi:hypothetical protein
MLQQLSSSVVHASSYSLLLISLALADLFFFDATFLRFLAKALTAITSSESNLVSEESIIDIFVVVDVIFAVGFVLAFFLLLSNILALVA